MFEKFKATVSSVSEGAAAAASAGSAKAKQAVEEITAGFGELQRLGLTAEELEVQVGLIPTLLLTLARPADIDDDKIEALIAAAADKKYWKGLLSAILAAEKLADQIQPRGQRLIAYRFELSVPPRISLVFHPNGGSSEVADGDVKLVEAGLEEV